MGFFSNIFSDIVGPVVGGLIGGFGAESSADNTTEANRENASLQREFAQNGVRWRVDDARAAGINPLAALGMNPVSASPSFIGDDSYGDSLSDMGQDLSRAIGATRTQGERDDALYNLSLDRGRLQNDLLRSQLAASKVAIMQQAGGNPAFPGEKPVLDERTMTRPADRATTASQPKPAVSEFINKDGSVTIWPSPDAKNATEDNPIYEAEHVAKNRFFPWLQDLMSGPWADEYVENRYQRVLNRR